MRLKDVKIITALASHTLSGALDLYRLAQDRTLLYEPELFPAVNFKMKGINFCCFHMGKVVITGIRRTSQIDGVVYLLLIELELYVRTSMEEHPVERGHENMNDIETNMSFPSDS